MKISVIIPTYKPKEYIWECLDSLVCQTFPKDDFEVIIVLNGCCKPWKREIENYIELNMADMNLRFIQTDTGGVSNARNIGLDCASGEYITFIDDDDYISRHYLKCLYEKAAQSTIVLANPYAFNDGLNDIQVEYQLSTIYNDYCEHESISIISKARKFFSGPCMKLIPMSCIKGRRYDIRFKNGEDSLFMFLISDRIKYITFASNNAIYYRRRREGSAFMARRTFMNKLSNSLRLIGSYIVIYLSNPFKYNFLFFITRTIAALRSSF